MNLPHDHEDELQSIWRKDAADSRKEDYTMTLQLVREKGRTLHEFLRGGDTVSYMLLVFVPVVGTALFLYWKSHPTQSPPDSVILPGQVRLLAS